MLTLTLHYILRESAVWYVDRDMKVVPVFFTGMGGMIYNVDIRQLDDKIDQSQVAIPSIPD